MTASCHWYPTIIHHSLHLKAKKKKAKCFPNFIKHVVFTRIKLCSINLYAFSHKILLDNVYYYLHDKLLDRRIYTFTNLLNLLIASLFPRRIKVDHVFTLAHDSLSYHVTFNSNNHLIINHRDTPPPIFSKLKHK